MVAKILHEKKDLLEPLSSRLFTFKDRLDLYKKTEELICNYTKTRTFETERIESIIQIYSCSIWGRWK